MHHKLIAVVIVLLGIAGAALAQENGEYRSAELRETIETQFLATAERLELTESQRAELEPIFQAHFAQIRAVLESHGLAERPETRPSRRELIALFRDLRPVNQQTEAQVEAILSTEQMDVYREMQDERRARMRARFHDRSDG